MALPSACQAVLVTIRGWDSRKGEPVGVGVGWGGIMEGPRVLAAYPNTPSSGALQ